MLGMMSAQVTHEAMDGAQTHIARAGGIFASGFQVLQEGGELFDCQLLDRELAGISLLSGHELQEQLQAIPITVERVRTQGALARQVISEEAVQRGCQRGGGWVLFPTVFNNGE